ncbi:hypothetical protein M413DRAFT_443369 [Hebeloma cylindrosporum]|uniref:Uncharacterized protein n=1 Tax=Hebeloma cylindrosporum TaxID=76867 RepID=A0A0C2Y0M8_HEBCY|nr:hypothetical protein M413DRAFT_443369 [Hebeloma cylindrosporum h7]
MLLNVVHGELRNRHYRPTQPLYDAVKGIRTIARGNDMNPPDPYLFAQFHCLHDLSSSVIGKDANGTYAQTYRNRYFRFLLNLKSSNDLDQKSGFLSNMLTIFRFDSRFVSEENTIAILDIVNPDQELSPTLSRHFAECNLRLLAAVYSKAHRLDRESEPQKSPPLMISPFSLTRAIWSIKEDEIKTEFVRQWSLCIHAFFSTIIHSSPDDLYLKHSFHSHTFFRWYLQTFRNQVYSTTYDSLDSEILTIVVSTITEISVALNDFPNPQRDFLFCVASYYAKLLATGNFRSGHPNVVSAVSTLLEALRNYKAHDQLVWEILRMDKIMETPSFSDKEWWGFLNSPEASIYSSRHSGMGVEGGTMRLSASVQRVPKAASCRVRSHPDIPSFS